MSFAAYVSTPWASSHHTRPPVGEETRVNVIGIRVGGVGAAGVNSRSRARDNSKPIGETRESVVLIADFCRLLVVSEVRLLDPVSDPLAEHAEHPGSPGHSARCVLSSHIIDRT